MSNQAIFWVGLMGAAATIPIVQTLATAATAPEIARMAKAITVQISEPNSTGSGVIIQQQGDVYTVLTAAHVVRTKNVSYTISTPDGKKYQVMSDSIRRPSVDIDLAVVKFRASANYPIAKLGDCNLLTEGMDVYVGGYPGATAAINKSLFLFKKGIVISNSTQILDKGYSLIYDNQTIAGMSGGSVLNQNGELVAIHGVGDRSKNVEGELGEKNGNNLGIPINRFASIASNLGVNLNQKVANIQQSTVLKAGDYYALATQKVTKRDFQGALADYDRVIQIAPKFVMAYRKRAWLKGNGLKNYQGALADYTQAIQLVNFIPQEADIYLERAELKQFQIEDYQGALADYTRAIDRSPDFKFAYQRRGSLRIENLHDYQGGLADYNQVIKLDPKIPDYYFARAYLKRDKLNDYLGGLADYNRAIQLTPATFLKRCKDSPQNLFCLRSY